MKNYILWVVAATLACICSCSEIFPPKIDTEEHLDRVIAKLNEVDKNQYKIGIVNITEKDKLTRELGNIYESCR